jgi:Transposase DDE domain
MSTGSIGNDWQQLLSYLPKEFRRLANEYRQLETQYGNAKINTAEQLLRVIFVHVGASLPLRQSVALIEQAGGVSISHVTLHQKMRRAAPYLQALVHEMSVISRESAPAGLWAGYDVVAIDATTDSTPGSTGTDMRLHTAIRVADLTVLYAEATGASGGETFKRFPLQAGQLALADRGYSNGPGIASAVKKGADVVCRLNRGALPLIDRDGRSLNVLECLRSLKSRRVGEWTVHVETTFDGMAMVIPGRLIAVRLPKEEADEARQRVRKEYGRKTSDDMLEAASYVALFTTVPSERMTPADCIALYRLRWQVELLFKRWKSICGLDELPNFIEDTVLSWVLGKILLALILDRMGSVATELFPPEQLDAIIYSLLGHAVTSPAA